MKTQGFLLKYPEGKSEINIEGDLSTKDLIVTTWQELKDKRDAGKLIPGSLYRITDYNCTTTQENTRSAGHQFDIVLLALSANKLAEEGWAMMNDNIYDVTFSDGVTKKCYIYLEGTDYYIIDITTMLGYGGVITDNDLEINEQLKTAISDNSSSILTDENYPYNYFQNSNLSAWKVWYCLDNDTTRFAWAGNIKEPLLNTHDSDGFKRNKSKDITISNQKYEGWSYGNDNDILYTLPQELSVINDVEIEIFVNPISNVHLYTKQGANMVDRQDELISVEDGETGKGVIYRLIDEWNNDVGYDFKNIQFIRKLTDGALDTSTGTNTWVYTFVYFTPTFYEMKDSTIYTKYSRNNTISPYMVNDKYALSRNVIFYDSDSKICNGVDNTLFGNNNVLYSCSNCVMGTYGGLYINCDGLRANEEDGVMYFWNKKVLTEE